ncbi:hypothetical protein [Actinoplanes flavus]|uniref:PE-PGRS family protein n=1 Tax=Actinoplanes flavus TaxID=2820290 RepID=A0ABS3UH88_9ACTN|nr:hypothetical protein [Actinoplanes flavus]MBO3738126.1 hypothetical protein [Actinoplanes flavus]
MLSLPAGRKPPSTAAGLLDLLEEGGGAVQVKSPPEEVRAAWRRLLHAVKQNGEVPAGWHLLHRGRNEGDLTIELRPGEHPAARYRRPAAASAVPVPAEVVDPHPVVDRLCDQPDRLPASAANRSRTLMIVQALADAASSKGYRVASGERDTLVVVEVADQRYGVRIAEETGKRWNLRLVVELDGPGEGVSRWADYAQRNVEADLPEVLKEMERRTSDLRAQRDARQRAEQRRLEQKRQRKIIKRRDKVLREQVAAWKLARQIRDHCDQLLASGMPADDSWLVWARTYAAQVDPLCDPPVAPPDPSPTEPAEDPSAEPIAEMPSALVPQKSWHPNRRWYHG